MAAVYLAEHVQMRREVALKVLDVASGPAALAKRFEREARAVARLDHPGCVRVFDYGRSLGRHYLAMELLDGPTLATELTVHGRLPAPVAATVAGAMLGALAHAHSQGVLHRDIKPSNVMFTRSGGRRRPVLIDFGLARLDDEGPLTAAGICAGSPSYIAPERLAGAPYDERADLYAVGVMLFEMLAGRRPFEGASAKEIARRRLHQNAPPLWTVAPDVPLALATAVDRVLAKEPAHRYAGAEAMRAAIAEGLGASQGGTRSRRPPLPAGPGAETTLLELDLVEPSWFRRILAFLLGKRRERTVDVTSVA
jgi:serine/threonine-protein kinase